MNLTLDPLRPYAALLRWGAALLLVGLLLFAGYRWGAGHWEAKHAAASAALQAEQDAHKATKARQAEVLDGLAKATAAVAARAREATRKLHDDRQVNDDRYDQALAAAQRARADLRDALRRGDVQLQPWWSFDPTGAFAGDAGAVAGGQDGHTALRLESLLQGVQDGHDADAWIQWLQSEVTSTRRRVVEAGCAVEASP